MTGNPYLARANVRQQAISKVPYQAALDLDERAGNCPTHIELLAKVLATPR